MYFGFYQQNMLFAKYCYALLICSYSIIMCLKTKKSVMINKAVNVALTLAEISTQPLLAPSLQLYITRWIINTCFINSLIMVDWRRHQIQNVNNLELSATLNLGEQSFNIS